MARGERLSQQGQPRSFVEEQVEDQPVPGLTSHPRLRLLAIGVGGLALLVGLFFMGLAGWVLQEHSKVSPRNAAPQRIERRLGDHVDGQLAFRIEESRCGVHTVGVEPDRYTAAGQYCIYQLRVRNAGYQPRILLSSPQSGMGSDGKKYEPNLLASKVAGPNNNLFPHILWRGQEATVTLAFDVGNQVSVVSLVLHDFPWSHGVRVAV